MAQDISKMETTQTAVEWLYKELTNYISYDDDKAFKQHEDVTDIVNQAKAMEKQQITKAFHNGMVTNSQPHMGKAEQYYHQTFKK